MEKVSNSTWRLKKEKAAASLHTTVNEESYLNVAGLLKGGKSWMYIEILSNKLGWSAYND